MEKLTRWNKLWLYINPRRSVIAPTRWTLELWDRLNRKRRVVGTGGVDAHAHFYPIWRHFGVRIFPYKVHFRSILSHVLLDKPMDREGAIALRQLFDAMRGGRLFISNRFLGDARGFRFWAEDVQTGKTFLPGDRVPGRADLQFHIRLPDEKDQAILIKDNHPVWRRRESAIAYRSTEPGVYRLEVRRRHRAFIFSNPIVIES
jgi:hypothetical protein